MVYTVATLRMQRPAAFLVVLMTVPMLLALGGSPNPNDIDGDGLLNGEEDGNHNGIVDPGETDPYNADTDRGGEADGAEKQAGRNPLYQNDDFTFDQDGDGLTNGQEATLGTDPLKTDTDGDGVGDKEDPFPLEKAYTADKDKDGLPDEYETKKSLDPVKKSDAADDADNDKLSNLQEFVHETDPENPDTDGDGIDDGEEVTKGTSPVENPCLFFAGPSDVFHDVENHWGKNFVMLLQEVKSGESGPRIVDGYPTADGGREFLPDRTVTRFELLKMALLSSCIDPVEPVEGSGATFADVRKVARPHESATAAELRKIVYTASLKGIVEGYANPLASSANPVFKPDEPVNRAEALKILFKATGMEPFDESDQSGKFPDVDDAAWYAEPLHRALSYGFIEGYKDGTFKPGQSITRAEAAKIILYMMISNPHINGYVVPTEGLEL